MVDNSLIPDQTYGSRWLNHNTLRFIQLSKKEIHFIGRHIPALNWEYLKIKDVIGK